MDILLNEKTKMARAEEGEWLAVDIWKHVRDISTHPQILRGYTTSHKENKFLI